MAEMSSPAAARTLALSGVRGRAASLAVTPAAPAERISLRARSEDVAALSAALGLELPTRPKTSAANNGRTAHWLGPDEWLVIGEGEKGSGLMAACVASGVLHSAVDVSHRNTAILVEGAGAAAAINAGCPLDLSLKAFPVGACTRTIFGKVEIVLLRTGEESFRVEVWRSFSDYAYALLAEGALDATF
ncbi:sarcosine oxidase subunit gamma family protein [Rhizobium halophilum]|uniref:sarcosine oxidase subunit gamma family protein n=1 Tax=Rhizobium halophilum TaxID=2846852 RepID=UPI001EFCE5A5|nr:sarcosine oxidase subunit gamma [Rhizobium halophilum]MCF6367813.1 sarcosine oxidase subunit gamma [Rhizobium halophilum]